MLNGISLHGGLPASWPVEAIEPPVSTTGPDDLREAIQCDVRGKFPFTGGLTRGAGRYKPPRARIGRIGCPHAFFPGAVSEGVVSA